MRDDLKDITLECIGCRAKFTWDIGEQRYFSEHGLNPPRRCKPCRLLRKRLREGEALTAMSPIARTEQR